MMDLFDVAAWSEQIAGALDRLELYDSIFAQLVLVARQLAGIEGIDDLVAAVPALALAVFPRAAVALLRVSVDGWVEVRARGGAPFETPQPLLDEEARAAVRAAAAGPPPAPGGRAPWRPAARRAGRAAVLPLLHDTEGWVLAVERKGEGTEDDAPLAVLGSLVVSALGSQLAATLQRDVAARDAAVLASVQDAVLAVDRAGVVRAASGGALAVLRVRRDELVGRRLRDVPGLAALAAALASGAAETPGVPLPHGDVAVRAQPYEHGVVAVLRDDAAERPAVRRASRPVARHTFQDLVGAAPAFLRTLEDARRAAQSDVPILISGESGTGKELLAQAIHNGSPRSGEPFVGVNVTAIPRELPESELFGYEAGAFTGASAGGHAGKFELAGRGTLLLDEIGDMPAEMQAKLLRVLQERVVQRVGSARDVPVHARIIATSHQDLQGAVGAGRFRLDLFHRLRVIHLTLPPLRERKGDVPLLVERQLRLHAERTGRPVRLAPRALELLEAYDWPGNVRELVNLVDGELSLLRPGQEAFTRLPEALRTRNAAAGNGAGEAADEVASLEALRQRACEEMLARFQGNVARAAAALGVPKRTLYARIKRYGIQQPAGDDEPSTPPPPPEDAPVAKRRRDR